MVVEDSGEPATVEDQARPEENDIAAGGNSSKDAENQEPVKPEAQT